MSRVRVFLPTYRRHALLPRALESLRRQTFQEWECEVHNDEPEDPFPEELVAKARDPRIRIVNHPKNLGGAATMNAFYAPAKEEFVSILEDDNWWEPEFLEEMVKAAEKHPYVTVFWSNMKIWQEQADGSFISTGKQTYPEKPGKTYEEFWWPDDRQIFGAIHSNGACLIRSRPDKDFRIPPVPFAAIEWFRERAFPQPLLLVRKVLANFSITQNTERKKDHETLGVALAALAAAFFSKANWPEQKMRKLFKKEREKNPPSTNSLLNAALLEPKARIFLRLAKVKEIIRWIAGLLIRPKVLFGLLTTKHNHSDWWDFLDKNTEVRFQEALERSETSKQS